MNWFFGNSSRKRPIVITFACFFLLITGLYHLLGSSSYLYRPEAIAAMHRIPFPYIGQVTLYYTNLLITVICAYSMLQAHNWARWTFLGWDFLHFVYYNNYIQPDWLVSLEIYAVTCVIFIYPKANAYFTGPDDALQK